MLFIEVSTDWYAKLGSALATVTCGITQTISMAEDAVVEGEAQQQKSTEIKERHVPCVSQPEERSRNQALVVDT